MLKEHARIISKLLWASDIIITISSFFLAYWLRGKYLIRWDLGSLIPLSRYTWLLLVIVPVWAVLLKIFDAYRSYRTVSFINELMALGKTAVTGGLVIGAIAFATKSQYLSRVFILTFVIVNIILLGVERFCIRSAAWLVRKRGYNFRNVAIVGSGEIARDVARRIKNYTGWGLRVLGFVAEDDSVKESVIEGHPVLGSLAELEDIVERLAVDEVIVAVSNMKLEDLEDAFLMLEDHGINARMIANIFPHVIAKIQMEEFESIPLLTFSTVPTNVLALYTKRVFDIVLSAVLLVVSAPIMMAATIAIKATSPGPVLFRQQRCGLHGRLFTLYKFRSMYRDAEVRKKDLERYNEMGGPVFKMKDDPRITPFGRYMRRASIDELPQLWNVLKGDMSIVGPRPPVPEEVSKYQRWQRRRLSMRPGITCIWQISGRNDITDFDEWVKLDLQYIDTWSLALDLKIFLKTIPVVLLRKGAV